MANNGLWNLFSQSKERYPELFIEYHAFNGIDIMQYTQYDGQKDKDKPTLNIRFDKNGEIDQITFKERKYDRGNGVQVTNPSILPSHLKEVYEDFMNKNLSYEVSETEKEDDKEDLEMDDDELEM